MKKENEKHLDSNLLEGMVSIRALFESKIAGINNRPVEKILFDRSKKQKHALDFAYCSRMAEVFSFPLVLADAEEIDALTIGSSHGGVIAVCGDRSVPLLANETPDGKFFVMIEGVEDPYNFGNTLRTLYAAGADGIILPPRNWLGVAGVVARSSAGASERFRFFLSTSLEATEYFQKQHFTVVCAEEKDAVSMYDADLTFPLFLLIGGEKRGISASVLNNADLRVRIDYGRDFRESLSTSSAASALAFEILRQNRGKIN